MTPQLILTLSPEGGLTAELPGANGARRQIEIKSLQTISRILHAQLGRENVEIGLDGAPTARQVRHWERHTQFPDQQCPFCLRERKARAPAHPHKQTSAQPNDGTHSNGGFTVEYGDSGFERVHITKSPSRSPKLASAHGNQTATSGTTAADLF